MACQTWKSAHEVTLIRGTILVHLRIGRSLINALISVASFFA